MKSPFAILLATTLLGLASCSDEVNNKKVDTPQAVKHIAWVGEFDDGFRVVLEAIAPPQDPSNARISEEEMLRSRLSLDEDQALLRLHLFGESDALQQSGTVSVGGLDLDSFGDAPDGLDIGQRLLWNTVLRGLPTPSQTAGAMLHRSVVLSGSAATLHEPSPEAVWNDGEREVPLQLRTWTEMDRGRFFEASVKPLHQENG
ncbi:MAG: hypothetical protein HQ519_09745 [Planctomycetes bacterium]|nr:hypothetical protein [Planctomycetota bacterium]